MESRNALSKNTNRIYFFPGGFSYVEKGQGEYYVLKVNYSIRPTMRINIKIIKHKDQRDEITGQWWMDEKGALQIRVSRLGNSDYEKLHIIHELFEAFASTYDKGVTDESVETFDKAFVARRKRGELPAHISEPGFDPECPYHDEHMVATGVEMLLASFLKVKWSDYEKRCREVSWEGKEF